MNTANIFCVTVSILEERKHYLHLAPLIKVIANYVSEIFREWFVELVRRK
jgi:hypothetical protein